MLVGCETYDGRPNRTANGALIGGGVGAATGAIIGNNTGGHHGGNGALIGGAIGAITGGLIGNSMDQRERARLRAQAPQTYQRIDQGQALQISDIKAMTAAGISDDVIISQIQSTRTVYHLNSDAIIDLHNARVSDRVVQFMINTGNAGAATVPPPQPVYVQQAPPPPPYETVVVAPGPGYIWCPGEWVWSGRWIWTSGHWRMPPRPHTTWVAGVWVGGPRGWHHQPGHWR